jgi:hypothetical protein
VSRPRPGKVLEAELRQFFRSVEAWSHGFDNVGASSASCPRCGQAVGRLNARRPADRIACYRGLSILCEAKETGVPRLPFAALQEHQARHLERHAETPSSGLSIVVIRWNIPRAPRAFAVTWRAFNMLSHELGRASIPLADADRPIFLAELPRRRIHPHDAGPTWDLRDYLDFLICGRTA